MRLESGAARDVDEALVRLAVTEARARHELGRLAARFLRVKGHNRLAFSCIGDYSRERLGISGRELQSFASVATKLEEHPLIASAFARGEISWSQTRLLCAIADAESEATWLERTRGLTVRDLVREIRRSSGACTVGDVGDALDEASNSTEGEPRARYSVPCPARITLIWRRAVELARRMLGSHGPLWKAAEAIVAENSSAVPIEAEETDASEEETRDTPRVAHRKLRLEETAPAPIAVGSLDAFELDRDMRARVSVLHTIDVELGENLRRLIDLRIHQLLSFPSFDAYARERLGLSPAKARALVAVERKSRLVPELTRAYRSGAISWARALAILPVVEGPHAAGWVRRAREIMVRRLHDEVEWALDMRDGHGRSATPPETGKKLERPDLQTCARSEREIVDRRVTFFGPASVVALFRAGIDARTLPGEPQWKGFERLLVHAITEWEAQPKHRDPVFARDGWRCCTPGCSARSSLEDHHIEFRSHGGSNELWNRLAACVWHHKHGVHGYLIRASGRAPDDVTWELGLRPGHAPLMRLHGERYLTAL